MTMEGWILHQAERLAHAVRTHERDWTHSDREVWDNRADFAATFAAKLLDCYQEITRLEAERDALARVAYQAAIDVAAFEQCIIAGGTDPEYAAERVRPMREALHAMMGRVK